MSSCFSLLLFISIVLFSLLFLVPLSLRDRSLEDLLTLPAPIVSAPNQRPSVPTTTAPPAVVQAPSSSPPIIVSSPIKASQDLEFMPAATTAVAMEKKIEPVSTFTIGDSLPGSSPKHVPQPAPVVKPPPPGAVHCKCYGCL